MKRKTARPDAPSQWPALPLDLAALVVVQLTASDKRALARSSSTGRLWVKNSRRSFRVFLASQKDLHEACGILGTQASELRLVGAGVAGAAAAPLSLSFRRLHLQNVEHLWLDDLQVTARSLEYLAQGLPRLSSLSLATSNAKHRINADGCLRSLAACPALRSLTVVNLASERGMDALTQLTALHLTLPDHVPELDALPSSAVRGYLCENCGTLHEEDAEELQTAYTDWDDKVAVGSTLRALSGLRRLTVDFQGGGEQINCKLNTLDLGAGPVLPALTSLVLLSAGLEVVAGRTQLLALFNALPALCRLDVELEGYAYYLQLSAMKDTAGRAVAVRNCNGRRWELERELGQAVAEE